MKERKQFTKEFKEGAVRIVTEQGRTIADAAQSLGISPWTMSRWVKAARSEGAEAFREQGQRTPQEQELHELRQKVRQLEEERAILK
jgi:transposase